MLGCLKKELEVSTVVEVCFESCREQDGREGLTTQQLVLCVIKVSARRKSGTKAVFQSYSSKEET